MQNTKLVFKSNYSSQPFIASRGGRRVSEWPKLESVHNLHLAVPVCLSQGDRKGLIPILLTSSLACTLQRFPSSVIFPSIWCCVLNISQTWGNAYNILEFSLSVKMNAFINSNFQYKHMGHMKKMNDERMAQLLNLFIYINHLYISFLQSLKRKEKAQQHLQN